VNEWVNLGWKANLQQIEGNCLAVILFFREKNERGVVIR